MSPIETDVSALSTFDLLRQRSKVFDQIEAGQGLLATTRRSLFVVFLGSASFGFALGTFSQSVPQILSSLLKVPLLLLTTAALCFPVFHILQSWRAPRPLSLSEGMALQSTSLAAVALVWGSLAPPLIFLVGSTLHYHLSQFLSLVVGTLGGVVGLNVLLSGYRKLSGVEGRGGGGVLLVYFAIFATVGGQLAWMLRPFLGSPLLPFQLFRPADPAEGNIFFLILRLLGVLA